MTKQRDEQADAAADPDLEVRPEVIEDLDVTGDDADRIAGGPCACSVYTRIR